MERWTWAYVLQQVIVLLAWGWVLRVLWGEVRGLLKEGGDE